MSIGQLHTVCLATLLAASAPPLSAATLRVGQRQRFARIEAAYAAARPGDTILVYAQPHNRPYEQVAIYVDKPRIWFRAVAGRGGRRVRLSGAGFDYTGRGRVPRAIFQFNRGADGCLVEGFELFEAHNFSYNGAAVRINQANRVTVRNCEIHHNDMGIMSGGDGSLQTAAGQLIEGCLIHHNGSAKHPGYNHNLYLGGTSVTLRACEVHSSLTGHNIKSRAHYTRVEYCYVHDSANREFDLVDHRRYTTRPESHAVLLGNIIVKAANLQGNRTVIHFGQDGGHDHDGTVYLVHNTIVTPYISPVIDLSAPAAGAWLANNIIWDGGPGQRNQKLVAARGSPSPGRVAGSNNWLSAGFGPSARRWPRLRHLFIAPAGAAPPFANPAAGDFHLVGSDPQLVDAGLPLRAIKLPAEPPSGRPPPALRLMQYEQPLRVQPRRLRAMPDLGAYELPAAAAP